MALHDIISNYIYIKGKTTEKKSDIKNMFQNRDVYKTQSPMAHLIERTHHDDHNEKHVDDQSGEMMINSLC